MNPEIKSKKWKRQKSLNKSDEMKVCKHCKLWNNSEDALERGMRIIENVTNGYERIQKQQQDQQQDQQHQKQHQQQQHHQQPFFDPETVIAVNDRTSCIDDNPVHFGVPVYCPFKGEPINLDFHIAPLIALVWACGIATSCSCEGYLTESSHILIEFYTGGNDLNRFLDIVFGGEPMNSKRVIRALGASSNLKVDEDAWSSFLRISIPRGEDDTNNDVSESDGSNDDYENNGAGNKGRNIIPFVRAYTSLLFPVKDYGFVLSKFRKEYEHRRKK